MKRIMTLKLHPLRSAYNITVTNEKPFISLLEKIKSINRSNLIIITNLSLIDSMVRRLTHSSKITIYIIERSLCLMERSIRILKQFGKYMTGLFYTMLTGAL